MTTTVLNRKISERQSKISDTSSLVTTTVLNTETSDAKNKYITNQEFNKLTTEHLTARLNQASLVSKTDFDNKLISFNRKITSNKAKYLKVQKRLSSLVTKD